LRASYFALVRRFPLRVLRSRSQYEQALDIVQALMARGDKGRDSSQNEYLAALALLVADYEQSATRALAARATQPEVLWHLLDQHGMRQPDLGRIIGVSNARRALLGERELSRENLRKVADYFKISPAVLM
jgi:antitoxin component HigA of HigAB toxin-antitoxin module